MRTQPSSLWSSPAFRALWGSDTISLLGVQATALALPLAAATLGATTAQISLLTTAQATPALLLGLVAGALVDRCRRRPLLIGANLARAALLASVPVAAALGTLHLAHLYLVALGGGAVAALASALALLAIRAPEPRPDRPAATAGRGRVIGAGVRFVLADPLVRPVLRASAVGAVAGGMTTALAVVYAVRDLGVAPAALGAVVGVGGLPALPAALLAGRAIRRHGLGATLIAASALAGGAGLLLPLAGGPQPVALALLVAWRGATSVATALGGIAGFTLIQAAPPPHLQGRVQATVRVVGWGAIALGGALGGLSGEAGRAARHARARRAGGAADAARPARLADPGAARPRIVRTASSAALGRPPPVTSVVRAVWARSRTRAAGWPARRGRLRRAAVRRPAIPRGIPSAVPSSCGTAEGRH